MNLVWKPYLKSAQEDWTDISDPSQRRRLQNRLSQRARRKTLAKDQPVKRRGRPPVHAQNGATSAEPEIDHSYEEQRKNPDVSSTSMELVISPSTLFDRVPSHADPISDTYFLVMSCMTSFGAIRQLVGMLQMNCSMEPGFHFGASSDTLPQNLKYTMKQQLVPHKSYVDVLPWPSLRDRVISTAPVINEHAFMMDMASMRIWGSTVWDPMSWEVSAEFIERWWFMMDDAVLRSTNFWRVQRGETPLAVTIPAH